MIAAYEKSLDQWGTLRRAIEASAICFTARTRIQHQNVDWVGRRKTGREYRRRQINGSDSVAFECEQVSSIGRDFNAAALQRFRHNRSLTQHRSIRWKLVSTLALAQWSFLHVHISLNHFR